MDSNSSTPSSIDSSVSPAAVVLPLLALITVLLGLPAFAWHIKSRNLAASCLVFWITLGNLWDFINPLIWPTDNTSSWWNGAGLCDIEVKLQTAATVTIPGALACIFRQLAIVLDTDRTTLIPSRAQRRRRLAFEIFFCFFWPVYAISIHYVVQPSRYYIFAVAGCTASFDNSWPSIVLAFIWPMILCLVDTYYCILVIYRLHKYRTQFASVLSSSQSSFTKSRFIRLFALSLTLILILLPAEAYILYRNTSFELLPYSWSAVHGADWSAVIMVPTHGSVNFDRWIQIGDGFLLFIFFGFGKDATLMYRSWLIKLGFEKCFPGLAHPHIQSKSSRAGSSSFTSRVGSIGSLARLILPRKKASSTSTSKSLPSRQTSIVTSSVLTEVVTPSPSEPQKTFHNHLTRAYGFDMPEAAPRYSWHHFSSAAGSGSSTTAQQANDTIQSKIWSTPPESPTKLETIKVKKEVRQENDDDDEVMEV